MLSMAFGYIYERTGTLWAPIALHVLFNGTEVAVYLFVKGG
jgi:membrane protease YdiL (CAAX protease family)